MVTDRTRGHFRSPGISRVSTERTQKNLLGIFTLTSLSLQSINVLMLILLFLGVVSINKKAPPTMVQLEGGRAISMAPLDSKERTPATIQKFVQDTLILLMSASGQLPSSADTPAQPDPGVEVATNEGTRKVPTLAHLGSFGLSEDFRAAFIAELAKRTPPGIFGAISGKEQVVLLIQDLSTPEPLNAGEWKVTMIANLVHFSSRDRIGQPTPFNKEIFVRSILKPSISELSSPLEAQIGQIRAAGLEIYAIRNYYPPRNPESNSAPHTETSSH